MVADKVDNRGEEVILKEMSKESGKKDNASIIEQKEKNKKC